MRYYLITGTECRILAKHPAKLVKGDLVVGSAEELHKARLSESRLLAILNGLPGAKKQKKLGNRKAALDRLWAAIETLPTPASKKAAGARAGRRDSKQARVVAMLHRPAGATVDAIAEEMGWQRHTVRGAISGSIKKKLGLNVVTEKNSDGERVYRIVETR
jgi:hypothetical protein